MNPEIGSEFRQFVETFRALGVECHIDYAPTKKVWQRCLSAHGFNITAHGCTAVVVGDTEYLFSNSFAHYLGNDENARGLGPTGVFLMQRNVKTGKVIPRKYFRGKSDTFVGSGQEALLMAYPARLISGARA